MATSCKTVARTSSSRYNVKVMSCLSSNELIKNVYTVLCGIALLVKAIKFNLNGTFRIKVYIKIEALNIWQTFNSPYIYIYIYISF